MTNNRFLILFIRSIVFFCLIASFSFAQNGFINAGDTSSLKVQYTIVNYQLNSNDSKSFDLNNDGINDFCFYEVDFTYPGHNPYDEFFTRITSLNHNSIFIMNTVNKDPKELDFNDTIGTNSLWSDTNFYFRIEQYYHYPPYGSLILGVWSWDTKYVGVKLVTSVDTLYGWFLIDVGGGVKIESYALQKPAAINVNEQPDKSDKYEIYPNPSKDLISISCPQLTSLEIYGCQGQLILKKDLEVGLNSLDVNNFAVGVYLVKLKNPFNDYKTEVIRFVKYN